MHISDGIIDTNICIAANVASGALVYATGKKTPVDGAIIALLIIASRVPFRYIMRRYIIAAPFIFLAALLCPVTSILTNSIINCYIFD